MQEMQAKDISSFTSTVTVTPQSEFSGILNPVSVLQAELCLKATKVRGLSGSRSGPPWDGGCMALWDRFVVTMQSADGIGLVAGIP